MRNHFHFRATAPSTVALLMTALLLAGCDDRAEHKQRTARFDDGKPAASAVTFDGDELTLRRDDAPTARITAAGDLLIDGKTVTTGPAQRAALIAYRKEWQGITEAGIEIGKEGAKLGVDAAGEAIRGVFNGDADKVDQKVEARAAQIKAKARKLCDNVERLRLAQDAAVLQVPQFKPYASMDRKDVDKCRAD